ncbi:MAG: PepSY-associated TM helix domain-containing protein, partial [Pseudomonadota bacterium]|nr:PepSY-associated TM helix domain-containing protein [Pseudomonadota bacterium]
MTTRLSTINRWARWLHIYSAAPVLLLMLFYSLTGVLLNHTTWHLGETRQVNQTFDLPEYLLEQDWQTESA